MRLRAYRAVLEASDDVCRKILALIESEEKADA
jgi:hypothetical protein